MLPSRHIIASVSLGAAVGFLTQSAAAGVLCFVSGVLIDADHIIEYIIHYGSNDFNFQKVYQACESMVRQEEEGGVKKLYLFLHAGEIAILLWVSFAFFKNIYLLSIALGYTLHLIMDAAAHAMKPWAYFITFRIKNGFSTIRLVRRY